MQLSSTTGSAPQSPHINWAARFRVSFGERVDTSRVSRFSIFVTLPYVSGCPPRTAQQLPHRASLIPGPPLSAPKATPAIGSARRRKLDNSRQRANGAPRSHVPQGGLERWPTRQRATARIAQTIRPRHGSARVLSRTGRPSHIESDDTSYIRWRRNVSPRWRRRASPSAPPASKK